MIAFVTLLLLLAGSPDSAEQRGIELAVATAKDIGYVGTGMSAWFIDVETNLPLGSPWFGSSDAPKLKTIDWSKCPSISYQALRDLLIPIYMSKVQERDQWGNPLEYCLDRTGLASSYAVGVRSAGQDGRFEGHSYERGVTSASDLDADILWFDGDLFKGPALPAQP
jgi:hypothetical protein